MLLGLMNKPEGALELVPIKTGTADRSKRRSSSSSSSSSLSGSLARKSLSSSKIQADKAEDLRSDVRGERGGGGGNI